MYFNAHYRHETYDDLETALRNAVRGRLCQVEGSLVFTRNFWVRSDNAAQDLVVVNDIAENDSYRVDEIPMPRPVVVDVGAHIGCFSRRLHDRNPLARIFAVECCPENLAPLQKNAGKFATVIQGAVTYEPDVALLNAVYADCVSTGGSAVIGRGELERRVEAGELAPQPIERPAEARTSEYWADLRPIRTLTLEQLMDEYGFDHIDILKLDCEGSEFSILGKSPSLERIGLIVGEYHGKQAFLKLVADRFADWELRILSDGDLGTFWLTNPTFAPITLPRLARNLPTALTSTLPPLARGGQGGSPGNGIDTSELSTSELRNRGNRGLTSPARLATADEFCALLAQSFHDIDRPQLPVWLPYYRRLFELARELKPRRFGEIGVRAGYSAFAFLSANPEATGWGIDADLDEAHENTHGGRQGLWKHAAEILPADRYEITRADSQQLTSLRDADLIYVDGDHTYDGCLHDLRLAAAASHRILVDDYDSIPQVRQACDTFTSEHPEFERRYIDNGLTGFLLLERLT